MLAQLACSAQRLDAATRWPTIVADCMRQPADADDPQLPLLIWWAIGAREHARHDRHGAVPVLELGPKLARLLRRARAPGG